MATVLLHLRFKRGAKPVIQLKADRAKQMLWLWPKEILRARLHLESIRSFCPASAFGDARSGLLSLALGQIGRQWLFVSYDGNYWLDGAISTDDKGQFVRDFYSRAVERYEQDPRWKSIMPVPGRKMVVVAGRRVRALVNRISRAAAISGRRSTR